VLFTGFQRSQAHQKELLKKFENTPDFVAQLLLVRMEEDG